VARILVIDDDATVGITLGRMLELQGHAVTRVETASDGLTAAERSPLDAVILDMRMPVMGGLDFVRTLRRDSRFERLPVGIVTGDYFLDDRIITELSALGATLRYKPVWMDDLAALTRVLLGASTQ
jgi:DNA-binding response OmpR family regulator